MFLALPLVGCGDRCEQLCQSVTTELDRCKSSSMTWQDLGSRGPGHFNTQCRDDWERVSSDLTATEVREALDVCEDTQRALSKMSCDEIAAIYANVE